jgi:hypothetical protein
MGASHDDFVKFPRTPRVPWPGGNAMSVVRERAGTSPNWERDLAAGRLLASGFYGVATWLALMTYDRW